MSRADDRDELGKRLVDEMHITLGAADARAFKKVVEKMRDPAQHDFIGHTGQRAKLGRADLPRHLRVAKNFSL